MDRQSTFPTGQTGAVGDSATFRLDGHVATITYNRPDALNAINAEMRRDLNDAFSRFRDDEEAWVAIVTGSTADPSIGRSCAVRLAREGASVVINGRDEERLAATEAALRTEGFDVVGVVGSMDSESAVGMLTDVAADTFGSAVGLTGHVRT